MVKSLFDLPESWAAKVSEFMDQTKFALPERLNDIADVVAAGTEAVENAMFERLVTVIGSPA